MGGTLTRQKLQIISPGTTKKKKKRRVHNSEGAYNWSTRRGGAILQVQKEIADDAKKHAPPTDEGTITEERG